MVWPCGGATATARTGRSGLAFSLAFVALAPLGQNAFAVLGGPVEVVLGEQLFVILGNAFELGGHTRHGHHGPPVGADHVGLLARHPVGQSRSDHAQA